MKHRARAPVADLMSDKQRFSYSIVQAVRTSCINVLTVMRGKKKERKKERKKGGGGRETEREREREQDWPNGKALGRCGVWGGGL